LNAGAAGMLLAALLVIAIWQEAAVDFVTHIAVALALHGFGLLALVGAYGFDSLRMRAQRAGRRAFRFLAVLACAASAACFASGLGVVVWGGLTVLGNGPGDPQTDSVPLRWSQRRGLSAIAARAPRP